MIVKAIDKRTGIGGFLFLRISITFLNAPAEPVVFFYNKTNPAFAESVVSKSYQNGFSVFKIVDFQGFFECEIIPTRCRDSHLKQFCLEDIAPATLIILITHIIIAVLWMLIKILSVVINHHWRVNTVVSDGIGVL